MERKKIKVGITGQTGFVGNHLYQYLRLDEGFELIESNDTIFDSKTQLANFVVKCDTIVHLAAMNRHEDPQVIYDTNMKLVEMLISVCKEKEINPHVLFASSSQEGRDNTYAKSKMEGRILLENWAQKSGSSFTGLIIPNVFGAFGRPNYNSVVATFCHRLNNNEQPEIHVDAVLELIYVNKLVDEIKSQIVEKSKLLEGNVSMYKIPFQYQAKVTEILGILTKFKNEYLEKGVFPDLSIDFEKDLFNTFRTYVPESKYPFKYERHTDDRGAFVEIARTGSSGQFSYSTTVPGITRGDHYHTRKAERFAVIKGKARIELRRVGTDHVVSYDLDGEQPSFVDMPIWTTHNIKNTGDSELVTLFWINEPYDPEDPDTYFEKV